MFLRTIPGYPPFVVDDTAKRLLMRIRQLREAHGLTQESFAERAGLAYKHYQQVEAGRKYDLRLSTLIKIAEGLGLKLSELFDFEASPLVLAEARDKYADARKKRPKRIKL